MLRDLYFEENTPQLSTFNIRLIEAISKLLDLNATFLCSSDITDNSFDSPTHRLVTLIKEIGGATYISGSGGQNYQDLCLFTEQSINVEYTNYVELPYKQNSPSFHPGLSCIDTLCNIGINATRQSLLQWIGNKQWQKYFVLITKVVMVARQEVSILFWKRWIFQTFPSQFGAKEKVG